MNVKQNEISVLNLLVTSEQKGRNNLFSGCVAGRKGLNRKVTNVINRPGLALNGVFSIFGEERVQLFGVGEIQFLYKLEEEGTLVDILEKFFAHSIACCIVSHMPKNKPPQVFIDFCEKTNCPLLYSNLPTNEVSIRLYRLLSSFFAPREITHGVFMEIHDIGVLITGKSGIGKSETALGLLDRGSSRIISDDVVMLERINETSIVGRVPEIGRYKHHMEIRGIGFVNLSQIYGVNVVLKEKSLSMVIDLKMWEEKDEIVLDRLEDEKHIDILGVDVSFVQIPLRIGRNIPLIIETAVIKHRLKFMGYHGKEDPFLW